MLPTKGYFQDIECPYYHNVCNRPYCHFRHKKKAQENNETEMTINEQPDVPTYKPTPKSELANIKTHIPISYVPDLAFSTERRARPLPKIEKPTYKPTPLSILSSANTSEANKDGGSSDETRTIAEIKQNIANVEYKPEALQNEINFEDLSEEFEMIDDLIDDSHTKNADKQISVGKDEKKSSERHSKNDKHKSKHHKSDRHRRDSHHSKEKSHEKDKHSRHKSRDKEKQRRKERDKKERDERHRKRSKDRSDHKTERNEKNSKNAAILDNKEISEDIGALSENEVDDDENTLMECYKIFIEYKPPETNAESETVKEETPAVESNDSGTIQGKKRIAHATGTAAVPKISHEKVKSHQTPGQVLANRLKLAKLAQTQPDPEVKTTKRPASSLLDAARNLKVQRTSSTGKKIAPVQNVGSIQRAKAKIEEIVKQKAVETIKTQAQTFKGSKRIAHVPEVALSDIPDVLNADKSKLPINVRTRFLTMIADEAVKLYVSREDAYKRALNEEFACYEKCKVLSTYRNSAMLAVNRLRKELQEREKLGLGPMETGETSNGQKSSDFKGRKFYENITGYVLNEDDLDLHGYPRESIVPGKAIIKNRKNTNATKLNKNQRKCVRCSKIYAVDVDGFVLYKEECVYHPLKKRTLRGEQTYLCCKSGDDTGCATAASHVCELFGESELDGYQTTMEPEMSDDPRSHAVYALDCEMCYTTKGLELTRVTIVDPECKTVYESLVKPLNPIIDYNTTFSGITKEQMDKTSTSILQVQANILHLCNSKTILIGHSLESDMKALKIIHSSIIDTSVLFPHKMGLPHKRALRVLASEYLKKIIQNDVSGHDSAEDAKTCMELVVWKLKEELKLRNAK